MEFVAKTASVIEPALPVEVAIGKKLRAMRLNYGFSLRSLSDLSGLNINTLCMLENGKSSPSVNTLQQLAAAFNQPITVFFEAQPEKKKIVYSSKEEPLISIGTLFLRNLGKDLHKNSVQPFFVSANQKSSSGEQTIVHTGIEFVYCLEGRLRYQVDKEVYELVKGDSLLFEAHLPHRWEALGKEPVNCLLVLCPEDEKDEASGRHFSQNIFQKERSMKIAVITDDGKKISQHFGRAPYYLVLSIEAGKVVNKELRDKMGHTQFSGQHVESESESAPHGMDNASHNKHISMADVIADCEALICGGMGMGAYESMRRLNIKPVVTQMSDAEEAVQAYIDGKLVDQTELLH